MSIQDPNKKNNIVNGANENSYDADDKVTNADNPVREGQEESSILYDNASNDEPQISKINDYDKHPHQMEEYIDNDKVNFEPED
jgi:hypothetical protein